MGETPERGCGRFCRLDGSLALPGPAGRLASRGRGRASNTFIPSEAITANGKFIPASTLMMDDYCIKCHQGRLQRMVSLGAPLSSFNNPAYRSSVRETRQVSMKRDGSTQAARWCAGCHDPVPFFSGEFDDPNYDDVNNPTSQAGITCTTCHAITHVNNTRGNAAYTIEEPQHYPFATSDDPILQWINNALVKAKPEMHKKTFFRPILQDPKFCSTCHKVGLPVGVTHYKDFVRGQNHYDTFLLSGVSGHGAQSFYYPRGGQDELQRVPHGAEAVNRLWRQGLRRQRGTRDPRPPVYRGQYRPGRLCRQSRGRASSTPSF